MSGMLTKLTNMFVHDYKSPHHQSFPPPSTYTPLPATVSPDGSQTQAQHWFGYSPSPSRLSQTPGIQRRPTKDQKNPTEDKRSQRSQPPPPPPPWAPAPVVRKRAQGWIGGRKGRGKRWGSRHDSSQAPGTLFFFFFFDYTNTYIHLEVQLQDPNNGVPVFYIYTHPSTRPHHHTNTTTSTPPQAAGDDEGSRHTSSSISSLRKKA